jgi:hypothetical protein
MASLDRSSSNPSSTPSPATEDVQRAWELTKTIRIATVVFLLCIPCAWEYRRCLMVRPRLADM